jgi:DNA-3-methyladenine glycosylase
MILPRSFYLRDDVVVIARDLLGKLLCTMINGVLASGIITETEAYAGATDKASHAYGGRNTARTEIMYRRGGLAYVYLCYGVHSLFNVVTNREGVPDAVLVRGIKPVDGIGEMLKRTGKGGLNRMSGTGPGKVTKLLGIHYSMTGNDLTDHNAANNSAAIWIEDRGLELKEGMIKVSTRIGVEYADEDAALPYRFIAIIS